MLIGGLVVVKYSKHFKFSYSELFYIYVILMCMFYSLFMFWFVFLYSMFDLVFFISLLHSLLFLIL